MDACYEVPRPVNEPLQKYAPGSAERESLKSELKRQSSEVIEIPILIGNQRMTTGNLSENRMPHDHQHVLAKIHQAGELEVQMAIESALAAREEWSNMGWHARAAIFLKAAELLSGPWRDRLNAATVLNGSKSVYQAEIDAAAELIDYFRFNVSNMQSIYRQKLQSSKGIWNIMDQRPLEGFVFAVTPFNFTSIAGNLPTAPAMMGNVVVWKPASSTVYIAYHIMELLREAGLPDGVINMVPGRGSQVGDPVLRSPDLAGVHFTGSTAVFQSMWKTIGDYIHTYHTYPRIVGETGGKDFIFAHPSATVDALAVALVRGAFEYQGQKCSAASRAYIPESLWPDIQIRLKEMIDDIKVGDAAEFDTFMGAVIDEAAFRRIMTYLDYVRQSDEAEIIFGGHGDDSRGYFVEPTVVLTNNPKFKTMQEEIFGPVLTVYIYPDADFEKTLQLCDETSPYGLTGSIFSQDRQAIKLASQILRHAAGNFYINDKPTGAVVGQQPFGGSRASGTNDKAGSMLNLLRWVSPRIVKENFIPPTDYRYPHMEE